MIVISLQTSLRFFFRTVYNTLDFKIRRTAQEINTTVSLQANNYQDLVNMASPNGDSKPGASHVPDMDDKYIPKRCLHKSGASRHAV